MSSIPAAEAKAEAGAPEEIEITPEMIEAGLIALYSHDEMSWTEEERITAVWRAMAKIKYKV